MQKTHSTRWTAVTLWLVACVALAGACSGSSSDPAPMCPDATNADYSANSGWKDISCAPTSLGCFPYFGSTADECGEFVSMRTSATTADQAAACKTLLITLNCGTYSDGKDTTLSFYLESADAFTMHVVGTYAGNDVDTYLYFNPCQQMCLAAITLKTIDSKQQKICDIPRQGKPTCLFPDTAHSLTFARADASSLVLRTASGQLALTRSK